MLDWGIVNIKTSCLSILYDLIEMMCRTKMVKLKVSTHPKISSLSTLYSYYLNNMTQIEFYLFKTYPGGGLCVTLYLCNMKEYKYGPMYNRGKKARRHRGKRRQRKNMSSFLNGAPCEPHLVFGQ